MNPEGQEREIVLWLLQYICDYLTQNKCYMLYTWVCIYRLAKTEVWGELPGITNEDASHVN